MNFTVPHRYKLVVPSYWADGQDDHLCDIMMSAVPSRDDVIDALRRADELSSYTSEFIDGLRIKRTDGWCYKTILVFSGTSDSPLWKFEPAP